MGRNKRNTVQTISNAIARIVLATGTQNTVGGATGINTNGTCIRVASAGAHQRYYEKHHKGASDNLKEQSAKLFCTPASDVIIAGSPSASSVVNAFEAASVHSELGRMLKTFSAATVDLFVKGPESVVDFAEKWIAQMSNSSAQKYLYELQGFGTLFSFLYYQVIQARKKYLESLKKAMLPNSLEAIDVLMQTLGNMRDVLLESSSSEDEEDASAEPVTDGEGAAESDGDTEGSSRPHSKRRQQRLAAAASGARPPQQRHRNEPPADSVASADKSLAKGPSLIPQQPAVPMDESKKNSGKLLGGRAPRRQGPIYASQNGSFEVADSVPPSVVKHAAPPQHVQTAQLATSVFQFGGTIEGGGGGADRRGRGTERLPKLAHHTVAGASSQPPQHSTNSSHQQQSQQVATIPGSPNKSPGLQIPLSLLNDRSSEPQQQLSGALTTTGLLSLVQQHGGPSRPQQTHVNNTNQNHNYDEQVPHPSPYSLHAHSSSNQQHSHQRLDPISELVGVAAVTTVPLFLHDPHNPTAVGVVGGHHHPLKLQLSNSSGNGRPAPAIFYSTTGHPNSHQLPAGSSSISGAYPQPFGQQVMGAFSTAGRSYPQPFNGPPLPLTARTTQQQRHPDEYEPPQHAQSARGSGGGWREYWEQEEHKKLENTISGCRGLVNYGKQRDLDQYGRELEAMRRQVYGEDDS